MRYKVLIFNHFTFNKHCNKFQKFGHFKMPKSNGCYRLKTWKCEYKLISDSNGNVENPDRQNYGTNPSGK
jgi:hypothetical protein